MSKAVLVMGGDGIGPEVIDQAVRVLEAIANADGLNLNIEHRPYGLACYRDHGVLMSEETLADLLEADGVLFGATGGPGYEQVPREVHMQSSLLRIRKEMDVFANLRPVRVPDALLDVSPLRAEVVRGTDLIFVRELTSGLYFGRPKTIEALADGGERGIDTQSYTTAEIERVARAAFDLAGSRDRRVCSVDKSNVMESGRLWRRVVSEVAGDYPDITLTHLLGDNCGMQLVLAPTQFDVILADNMFGDILSDVAAATMGTLGTLPSASFSAPGPDGRRRAFYEPVHGSAPDIAGQGAANPVAAILCVAMLLRHSLERPDLGQRLEAAVDAALAAGVRTRDICPAGGQAVSTEDMAGAILAELAKA
ncbi:MAG: 3-isopropylmalate dehydrogenase [Alphaproteobacteria bacterium]|jgi:3-isopropylmalate dehydrogenase|nr:3-isopropylmalate dehydrogenase [Alphaproteobacteria bacterium]MDP6566548.1 3-isopropylmalate dehydrogenase [Alphaproteobacteria bacterium]MDP6815915.1 3-isopropylmalate dehydrogenase [Alphaproteobacteria bacterium]